MPHCVVEYTAGIAEICSIELICKSLYEEMLATELFEPETIKVRAIPFKDYLSGGKKQEYMHLNLAIFSGRTAAQKEKLQERLASKLNDLLEQKIEITIWLSDIKSETYLKTLPNLG